MSNNTMEQQSLFVNMGLQGWNTQVERATKLFDNFSDEQMQTELAPGKNRPVYLLGHLTAVHDAMMPLLGLGERKYQHLDEAFLKNPDKSTADVPSIEELRTAWNHVHQTLSTHFKDLPATEWLDRHTSVSPEDFAKEPHRNKLNVLLGRTNHLSYHLGQLMLGKK